MRGVDLGVVSWQGLAMRNKSQNYLKIAAGCEDRETCVAWPLARTDRGYGVFYAPKAVKAHRAVLEMAKGPPPPGKPWALHGCGSRGCINPHHLRWGTPKENFEDMVAHGTYAPLDDRNRTGGGPHRLGIHATTDRLPRNNTNGFPGVYLDRKRNRWRASCSVLGVAKKVPGRHPTPEAAYAARVKFLTEQA